MSGPYKVGMTGGIGSGKSAVSRIFAAHGIEIIDADNIVRELTDNNEQVLEEIISVFGPDIIDSAGKLDRLKLKGIIFADVESKSRLETILHPHVFTTILHQLESVTSPYCVLSMPLLIETDSRDLVDTVLVVDCPVSLQIERVVERDGLPVETIEKIITSQISRDNRLKAADEIITNDGDIKALEVKVLELHREYLGRAEKQAIAS